MTIRAPFHIFAHGDHAIAGRAGGPAIELAHHATLRQVYVRAVGPCFGFVIRIVDRADDGRLRQTSGDTSDYVCRPQVTMNHVGLVFAQPGAQRADAAGNVARRIAVQANGLDVQGPDWFQPMRRVRINGNHGALDAFGIEVFEVRVEQSFRAAGTESLDEMNDLHVCACFRPNSTSPRGRANLRFRDLNGW